MAGLASYACAFPVARKSRPRWRRKVEVFLFLEKACRTGVVSLRRQRALGVGTCYAYVPVMARMASWKLIPKTWTNRSMVLPARFRSGQRQ